MCWLFTLSTQWIVMHMYSLPVPLCMYEVCMYMTSTHNLHLRAWVDKKFYQLYPPCSLVIYPVIYNVQPHVDIFYLKYTCSWCNYNKHTTGCSICLQRHSNLWCQKFGCHLPLDKVFFWYTSLLVWVISHTLACTH